MAVVAAPKARKKSGLTCSEPKLFSNFQNFPFFPSESFRGYRENMYTAAVFFRRPPREHAVPKIVRKLT